MIISHSHKFVTICVQKAGSSTLRNTLIQRTNTVDYIGGPHWVFKKLWQHATVKDIKGGFIENGWNFNEYFKFSLARNPWKRYASWLMFIFHRMKEYKSLTEAERNLLPEFKRRGGERLLEMYADESDTSILAMLINKANSQEECVCDSEGNLAVDMLGTLENINGDFGRFCEKVNIIPTTELLHKNKSTYSKPYIEYYNQELIDLVAKKEKWVIDKFKYDL